MLLLLSLLLVACERQDVAPQGIIVDLPPLHRCHGFAQGDERPEFVAGAYDCAGQACMRADAYLRLQPTEDGGLELLATAGKGRPADDWPRPPPPPPEIVRDRDAARAYFMDHRRWADSAVAAPSLEILKPKVPAILDQTAGTAKPASKRCFVVRPDHRLSLKTVTAFDAYLRELGARKIEYVAETAAVE